MNWSVDHVEVLWGIALSILPFLRSPIESTGFSWIALLPADWPSRGIDLALRLAGAIAIVALILGLAGLHRIGYEVTRQGVGGHLVLLLDRSQSMDDSFAGETPTGEASSKSSIAANLLSDFVQSREHDRIGVAAFSSSPLFVLPLTDYRPAVLAAINAMRFPALAQTHVSKGLAMALSFFDTDSGDASRSVMLVSDGAAVIDPDNEAKLRRWFTEKHVHLYWIFIRTAGSPGLFEVPEHNDDDTPQARPERHLHLFFQSLGIPYHAYEAENPDAMQKAMADIDSLERKPLAYTEKVPRQDWQGACYWLAVLALCALSTGKLYETLP